MSFSRTHARDVQSRIADGFAKNRPHGFRSGARAAAPSVLAMYDVSIRAGGRKWQPAAGEPVRVTMALDEPVPVSDASALGVAHLADDGTVEALDASRYGFTYNAARSAVTAFWFDASGFSVYAIVDEGSGNSPGRRLYGFYSLDSDDVTYVPRYFATQDGNRSYRQIVKSGEKLMEPEALPSPLGRTFMGWFLYDAAKAGTSGYDANGYATEPFDFSRPVVFDAPGEEDFALRAVFAHNAHVIFHEQPVNEEWPITGVRRAQLQENANSGKWEAKVPIDDMVVTYDDTDNADDNEGERSNATPRMIFRGWSRVPVMPGAPTNILGAAIHLEESPFVVRLDAITSATLGPTHLYPVFVNINWITFKSAETGQGATYIPPKYYYADEGTNRFPVPVRTGYVFNGWWTGTNTGVQVSTAAGALITGANLDAWGGQIRNGKLMLSRNMTLFGRWDADYARYTVVVWRQKATDAANLAAADKTYDFAESFSLTALSESPASVAQAYKDFGGSGDYAGFSFARCDGTKAVDGSGSTVLNVYYDRNVHTLKFRLNDAEAPVIKYVNNNTSATTTVGDAAAGSNLSTLESNKKSITGCEVSRTGTSGNRTYYVKVSGTWYHIASDGASVWSASSVSVVDAVATSVTALAGASIKDCFPIVGTDGTDYTGKTWAGDIVYKQRLAALEVMPDADITFTLSTNQGAGGTILYYVEVGSQDEHDLTRDGMYYKLYKTIVHDFNFLTFQEDFHPLDGYKNDLNNADITFVEVNGEYRYPGNTTLTAGTTVSFYYPREGYSITFADSYDNRQIDQLTVKYGEFIAGSVPADPTSSRDGYHFTGWYADANCSTRVFFNEEEYNSSTENNKVLYDRMPAHNLQVFAGWETEWYLIQIDPNGGEMASGQSTWFWEAYNGDPIEEYGTVTRSFEEADDGTWFYAVQNRASYGYSDEWTRDEAADRRAYYTQDQTDPAIANLEKRYHPAVNAYRYAGWYEVLPDGTEELYAFGQPVQRNTYLRLHWKQIGTYRLVYSAGKGTMSNGDENEGLTFTVLDSSVYADNSEVLVTRTADAPEGFIFVGWKIRNGDETLYRPGQTFTFNAAFATMVPGPNGNMVRQLVLDAVYRKVTTLSLVLDANGGTVGGDASAFAPDYADAPAVFTNASDSAVTVSGIRNNAYGYLSNGTGFSCVVDGVALEFLGWNTAADGTGRHFSAGSLIGLDETGAANEAGVNALYAEWGVKVYFDLNRTNGVWNAEAWPTNYVWDAEKEMFYQTVTLNGYAREPEVALVSDDGMDRVSSWGVKRANGELEAFDFSQPITNGTFTLSAIWSDCVEVQVHAVEAAKGELSDKGSEWQAPATIRLGGDAVSLETPPAGCENVPEGYAYAFACVSDGMDGVSGAPAVTNVYYDIHEKQICVTYADGTSGALADGQGIYLVYFAPAGDLDIGYVVMDARGNLTDATVAATAPTTAPVGTTDETAYDMAAHVAAPLNDAGNRHAHYAYAIGKPGAEQSADLHLVTRSSPLDNERPALLVKESWDGYLYSLDGGANWVNYGFDAKLYVVYFDAQPTVVTLTERTIGTASDMREPFEYTVVVSSYTVTTTESQVQRQRRSGYYTWGAWTDYGETSFGDPVTNAVAQPVSSSTTVLTDGGAESVTLTYSSSATTWNTGTTGSSYTENNVTYRNRTNTRTHTETIQILTVTQAPKAGFTTVNDGAGGDHARVYTDVATGASEKRVTFTNTHTAVPVVLHMALGQDGAVSVRDDLRTSEVGGYTLSVTNGVDNMLAVGARAPEGIFTGDSSVYGFVGIVYGRTNENGTVTIVGTNAVTSLTFAPVGDGSHHGIYLNGDSSLPLGDYELYTLFCEMPRIYYVNEGANGALSPIDPIAYMNGPVSMDGGETAVTQGTVLPAGISEALTIATSGFDGFRVPSLLDGARGAASQGRTAFAAGAVGAAETAALDGVTTDGALQVKVVDGVAKWRVDDGAWNAFSGSPAVYVLYRDVGNDLTISTKALASDADRSSDVFVVTIASDSLTNGVPYAVSGYATDSVTPKDGVITLTVTGGCNVTIQSLPNQAVGYAVKMALPADYALTDVTVNGNAISSQEQTEGGLTLFLDLDKTVEFTNTKRYVVTFLSEDGETTLKAAEYLYGTDTGAIEAPNAPDKAMDGANLYRFAGWEPELGTVGSNTVYLATYRAIRLPQVTQRASATNIAVRLEENALVQTLKDQGIDILAPDYSEAAADAVLNAFDPNGLRRWENLVTGTATNQVLLSTSVESERTSTMRMAAGADVAQYVDLGYTVLRELRKEVSGSWVRVAGPAAAAGDPAFSIELQDAEGRSLNASGLYRVVTLLVPNHDRAITNEIPTANIIGVLEVNSAVSNTITAIPWKRLASDPAAADDITVSNYVAALNLSVGDEVYTLDAQKRGYKMWKWQDDGTWGPVTTIRSCGDGTYGVLQAEDADKAGLPRGNAAWVKRAVPERPYFLVGQYDAEGVSVPIPGADDGGPGLALIALPTFKPVYLNKPVYGDGTQVAIDWSVFPIDPNDQIRVPVNGVQTGLTFKNGAWGYYVTTTVWNEKRNKYVVSSKFMPYEEPIPAGTGFIYFRMGSKGFTFNWK